jgi:hypothetical protein
VITLSLPRIEGQGFQVTVVSSGMPRVRFSGNGDADAVGVLNSFLKKLHEELLIKQASSVEVDLGELYFMNSSCLKAFVSWIHKVNTCGRAYRILLLMNPRQQWQTRSLATLQRLAPGVVAIQELTG